MKRFILVLVLMIGAHSLAFATEPVIEEGFKTLKETGVEAAWKTWAKGGPLDGSKEIASQAAQFGQVGAYYGMYISHEYVFTKELGPRNKIVFVIMNLEKGPLFGRFLVFKTLEGKWVVPGFKFHSEPNQIWPSEILFIK